MVEEEKLYKPTKFDKILLSIILLFSISFIVWNHLRINAEFGNSAVALVYKEDVLLKELSLWENNIFSLREGNFRIEIKQGRVRVLTSDCPQQLCLNTGWIKYSGQMIICIPNKILIEVKSENAPFVDAVCY